MTFANIAVSRSTKTTSTQPCGCVDNPFLEFKMELLVFLWVHMLPPMVLSHKQNSQIIQELIHSCQIKDYYTKSSFYWGSVKGLTFPLSLMGHKRLATNNLTLKNTNYIDCFPILLLSVVDSVHLS